jgi:hypothetical protein
MKAPDKSCSYVESTTYWFWKEPNGSNRWSDCTFKNGCLLNYICPSSMFFYEKNSEVFFVGRCANCRSWISNCYNINTTGKIFWLLTAIFFLPCSFSCGIHACFLDAYLVSKQIFKTRLLQKTCWLKKGHGYIVYLVWHDIQPWFVYKKAQPLEWSLIIGCECTCTDWNSQFRYA